MSVVAVRMIMRVIVSVDVLMAMRMLVVLMRMPIPAIQHPFETHPRPVLGASFDLSHRLSIPLPPGPYVPLSPCPRVSLSSLPEP